MAGVLKWRPEYDEGSEEELRQAYEKISHLDEELVWLKETGPTSVSVCSLFKSLAGIFPVACGVNYSGVRVYSYES